MTGYQTLDGVVYVKDGIVSRWDYQKKQSEKLFETDYTDADVLFGFPDCMMIVNQFSQKKQEDVYHIREVFYDWDYRYLGECTIDLNPDEVIQLPDGRVWAYTLFGETEERILFCKHWHVNVSVPAYYIEKSDFGTGEIRLHEYHFPEE